MFRLEVGDYLAGVMNMIEAADIHKDETVMLLADRRSDPLSIEATATGLRSIGAVPMTLTTEPIARYGEVPRAVMEAMEHVDTVVWMWPVFITFTTSMMRRGRERGQQRETSGTQLQQQRQRPYNVYFEAAPGVLARDFARFPNEVLWKIAEKMRDVVGAGSVVELKNDQGTNLRATYDGEKLYGLQFRAGDPPGRIHFPWGRCGIYDGSGEANGVVELNCAQGIPGVFPQPMRWVIKDGWIVECSGGEVAEHANQMFREVPGSNKFVEIMVGYHPKADLERGIADPMHWEVNARMPWAGLGTGRSGDKFRHIDGGVFNTRVYINGRQITDDNGRVTDDIIKHADVRKVAEKYGDPDEVLAHVSHASHGQGALW
jgi:hypothetical protein